MVLLAVRDDRLGLAELVEHQHQLAPLDLLDLAREQLAHLVGELLADPVALTLAHPLDDPLLGRLHRAATESRERDFLFEHVAELEVGVLVARLFEGDLPRLVLDQFDDRAHPGDDHRAGHLVQGQVELDVRPEALGEGGVDAVLDEVEELGPVELFGGGELPQGGEHLGAGVAGGHRGSLGWAVGRLGETGSPCSVVPALSAIGCQLSADHCSFFFGPPDRPTA